MLTLSACSDGYSDKGDALQLAYGMSQQDTLAAMNQIGRGKHLKAQASFALLDACVLEMKALGRWQRQYTRTVPLSDTEATLTKQPDGDTYRVQLTRTAPASDPDPTVLDGATWAEATQMKWLLDYVRRFC